MPALQIKAETAHAADPPSRHCRDTLRIETASVTALCRFARAIGVSEEIAVVTYRREVKRLSAIAKVTRYVPLLAEKRAREALRGLAFESSSDSLADAE